MHPRPLVELRSPRKRGRLREALCSDRAAQGGEWLFKKRLEENRSVRERRDLVSSRSNLGVRKQCARLTINRSSLYYRPKGESPENFKIIQIMDKQAKDHLAEGVNSMVYMLRSNGFGLNHKRVRRLLRLMGHHSIYTKKNLSKLGQAKYILPYLLRNVAITRANQA